VVGLLRASIGFCVLIFSTPNTVFSASTERLNNVSSVSDALTRQRGDVVLALMPELVSSQSLLAQLASPWSRFDVQLNGQTLGQYRPGTLLQVTPRLGQNRIQLKSTLDPDQAIELKFGAMRAAGVATGMVAIEAGVVSPVIVRPISKTVTARIKTAIAQRQDGGLARIFALIRSGGVESTPAVVRQNWRSRNSAQTEIGGSDGGSDDGSGSDSAVASESTASAPSNNGADDTTGNSGETSVSESAASTEPSDESSTDSGFDVSADRRSYY